MKNNDSIRLQMYSYLKKWRATDLDMKAFCKEHNISYYSFKYWKYRQRDENSSSISRELACNTSKDGQFLPMQISTGPLVSDFVVNFPNGVQLNCSSDIRLEDLSKLIKSY